MGGGIGRRYEVSVVDTGDIDRATKVVNQTGALIPAAEEWSCEVTIRELGVPKGRAD